MNKYIFNMNKYIFNSQNIVNFVYMLLLTLYKLIKVTKPLKSFGEGLVTLTL